MNNKLLKGILCILVAVGISLLADHYDIKHPTEYKFFTDK